MGYKEVFPKKHTLLVVIHAESVAQANRNTGVAFANGADGVFLINHALSVRELFGIHRALRRKWPKFFIGLNCLGMRSGEMFGIIPKSVSGFWSDDAGIQENDPDPVAEASAAWKIRQERSDWRGIYFGGVAFKYQEKVSDPGRMAQLAMPYLDVVTTSGDRTGSPPTVGKMCALRASVGDFPIAIASGITPENVADYLPYTDCFLVATGVSMSFTELDRERVALLAKILK
ncbi:MAG: hypothetical protein G01um101448_177 [Parcubacteria group bacterium Gr01-1014_48]|nr:MAG: hypothetical protein Greene041614_725 [Parcubacteria group bacterium Greene0416_14]TSC74362.1 MAG: hypothetical protein G01um101448_177 [Parcubacteria group bacterium Gr01-1014_48]TSD00721.1 MAG: hypothetical protein Greene101415_721 [Parcubacteria group bacterium Greene1014_15]TSD07684.1 MAG: hypothetical protein Greene07144_817 [Parcubacteria group bacterium Greene0714_4]